MKLQLVPKSVVHLMIPGKKVRPCSDKSCSFGTKARFLPPRCLLPFSSLLHCLLTTLPHAESLHSTCLQSHHSDCFQASTLPEPYLHIKNGHVLPRPLAFCLYRWKQLLGEFIDRRILAGTDIIFCQLEALLSFFCSEWLQILDFFPDAQPTAQRPFNSTLAQARLQEQSFNAAGSGRFL